MQQPAKPGHDALPNDGPFELGEDAHHLEHCFSGGRRGVDPLPVEVEVDILCMKLGKEGNKVL